MLRFNKVVILIFLVVLFATVALLVSYLLQSRGCLTGVESLSKNYTVKISDRDKWQNFIDTLGNCNNGRFTVYGTSGDGGAKLAKEVQYIISDEKQSHVVTYSSGEPKYTYSFSYDETKQLAKIILHFPDKAATDSNRVGGVFILTSYKLFKGKPMTETDENIKHFFNNINSLGLTYEKN